jgi:hypothetical protein
MPRLAPAPLQLADPEREALHALINPSAQSRKNDGLQIHKH